MINDWIVEHFTLINSLTWMTAWAVGYYRWKKYNRKHKVPGTNPKTGDYLPDVGLQSIQWLRPMLPWAAVAFVLNTILQYFGTYPGSTFVVLISLSAAVICVLHYVQLRRALQGIWKPTLLLRILIIGFYLQLLVSLLGYLIAVDFKV